MSRSPDTKQIRIALLSCMYTFHARERTYAPRACICTQTLPASVFSVQRSVFRISAFQFKYHFIYVGALSKRKGIDILLKAFSKIHQDEWGLIIVGKDTMNGKYHDLVKKLNIQNATNCLAVFKSNNFLGLLIFLILILGKI